MRVGDGIKPFEHFLKGVVVIVILANIAVVTLLWLGILKRPGSTNSTHALPVPSFVDFGKR